MNEDVRERVLFPVVVPIGILAGIAVVLFLFSRVLLHVPRGVAVAVALLTGLNILITCAIISVRRIRGFAVFALIIAIIIPGGIGAAAAAKVIKVTVPSKPAAARPTAPPPFKLSANNTAFSTTTIDLQEQNGNATIDFTNNDSVPHNVHIYNGADDTAPSVFSGAIVPGGSEATYDITGLQPGTYFFHCDVHPAIMTGKIVVTAFTGAGGSPAASNTITITAANTAFSKTSLSFTAGSPVTIKFTNNDTVPHNIHIFQGTSATGTSVFTGTIANAGDTETYNVGSLPAGSYFFRCDIHPTLMTGTITVT